MSVSSKVARIELKQSAVAKVIAKYPHLIPVAGSCSCTTAAKNIRIELKRAFPGVKFSVKSRKFSIGDEIDVMWTDGPQSKQVDVITERYSVGSLDGMTDCYHYAAAFTEAFGDAKFIHTSREYSDRFVGMMLDRISRRHGGDRKTVKDYHQGRCLVWQNEGGDDLHQRLSAALARHTFCITQDAHS